MKILKKHSAGLQAPERDPFRATQSSWRGLRQKREELGSDFASWLKGDNVSADGRTHEEVVREQEAPHKSVLATIAELVRNPQIREHVRQAQQREEVQESFSIQLVGNACMQIVDKLLSEFGVTSAAELCSKTTKLGGKSVVGKVFAPVILAMASFKEAGDVIGKVRALQAALTQYQAANAAKSTGEGSAAKKEATLEELLPRIVKWSAPGAKEAFAKRAGRRDSNAQARNETKVAIVEFLARLLAEFNTATAAIQKCHAATEEGVLLDAKDLSLLLTIIRDEKKQVPADLKELAKKELLNWIEKVGWQRIYEATDTSQSESGSLIKYSFENLNHLVSILEGLTEDSKLKVKAFQVIASFTDAIDAGGEDKSIKFFCACTCDIITRYIQEKANMFKLRRLAIAMLNHTAKSEATQTPPLRGNTPTSRIITLYLSKTMEKMWDQFLANVEATPVLPQATATEEELPAAKLKYPGKITKLEHLVEIRQKEARDAVIVEGFERWTQELHNTFANEIATLRRFLVEMRGILVKGAQDGVDQLVRELTSQVDQKRAAIMEKGQSGDDKTREQIAGDGRELQKVQEQLKGAQERAKDPLTQGMQIALEDGIIMLRVLGLRLSERNKALDRELRQAKLDEQSNTEKHQLLEHKRDLLKFTQATLMKALAAEKKGGHIAHRIPALDRFLDALMETSERQEYVQAHIKTCKPCDPEDATK